MPSSRRDAAQVRKARNALYASAMKVVGGVHEKRPADWIALDTLKIAETLLRMSCFLAQGAFQKAFDLAEPKAKNVHLREWTPAAFWTLFEE